MIIHLTLECKLKRIICLTFISLMMMPVCAAKSNDDNAKSAWGDASFRICVNDTTQDASFSYKFYGIDGGDGETAESTVNINQPHGSYLCSDVQYHAIYATGGILGVIHWNEQSQPLNVNFDGYGTSNTWNIDKVYSHFFMGVNDIGSEKFLDDVADESVVYIRYN